MEAANLGPRRLSTQELFEELKHAQHPIRRDRRPYVPGEEMIEYRSAREQATEASILNETETYLNIDGYLYAVVSLKELPDATFPGMLQNFSTLGFPSRYQRAGRYPRPGEGAQELQEAAAEDDCRAEGRERQLQIESGSGGCAGAAHPSAARHHLLLAQDGEAEPFGCRAHLASGCYASAISNGRNANSPIARRRS